MSKSKVILRSTRSARVHDIVREIFDAADFETLVPRGATVVVKVNLSTPFEDMAAASNTSPEILDAVCGILKERAGRVVVGESNGMRYGTEEAFEVSGYYPVLERHGAEAMSFTQDEWAETGDPLLAGWPVSRTLLEADVFISLPVLKTHATTVFTGTLKNQFGCFPQYNRILLHPKLDRVLVAINERLKPALAIMDGLIAMEGRGPINGVPRELGAILGSTDPVALDATAMRLVGLEAETCGHLVLAHEHGKLGTMERSAIEIDGPYDELSTVFLPAEKDLPIRALGWISHSKFLTEKLIMNPESFYPLRSAALLFRDLRDQVRKVARVGKPS